MILWRLSGREHALTFDGGYGLYNTGRWNSLGRLVTYSATSPSLCVLEKLVHIEHPDDLPTLVMVVYEVPDHLEQTALELANLPADWRENEALTQSMGDDWYAAKTSPLLMMPSAIVPVTGSPDLNVVINHSHPDCSQIKLIGQSDFSLDTRLL